jgi:hypothetical protein
MLRKLELSCEEAFSKGFELISAPFNFRPPKKLDFFGPFNFRPPPAEN